MGMGVAVVVMAKTCQVQGEGGGAGCYKTGERARECVCGCIAAMALRLGSWQRAGGAGAGIAQEACILSLPHACHWPDCAERADRGKAPLL